MRRKKSRNWTSRRVLLDRSLRRRRPKGRERRMLRLRMLWRCKMSSRKRRESLKLLFHRHHQNEMEIPPWSLTKITSMKISSPKAKAIVTTSMKPSQSSRIEGRQQYRKEWKCAS